MAKILDFLPTKLNYNQYKQEINMWYRLPNDTKLYKTSVPFNHYIYIEDGFNGKGIDLSDSYYHLVTGKPLYKYQCSSKDAWDICNNTTFETGEGDVNPVQRFISDNFADVEFPNNIKPRVFYIDIETGYSEKFPSFKNNSAEINAITIYDNYTNLYYIFGLIPPTWNRSIGMAESEIKQATKQFGKTVIFSYIEPKLLIKGFMDFIKKNIPDVLTAWNSKFDISYITRKIYDYFGIEGLKGISPFYNISSKITKALEDNSDVHLDSLIPGIDVLDMLGLYKKYSSVERESYKLNDVANAELGESKIGYEASDDGYDLFDLYKNDYVTFIKYNMQ